MRDTGWFTSSFSTTASDNCVEVRLSDGAARVRDSRNPASVLAVDVPALVAVGKAGLLDR